jgi:hypothetical protein
VGQRLASGNRLRDAMNPTNYLVLPRHKHQELLDLLTASRELIPLVQRLAKHFGDLAVNPELLKLRTAMIADATTAVQKTVQLDAQFDALITYVKNLERLTVPSPEGQVH